MLQLVPFTLTIFFGRGFFCFTVSDSEQDEIEERAVVVEGGGVEGGTWEEEGRGLVEEVGGGLVEGGRWEEEGKGLVEEEVGGGVDGGGWEEEGRGLLGGKRGGVEGEERAGEE